MPLPTPEEIRDRTKTNAQMRELLATLLANVLSTDNANANAIFNPASIASSGIDLNSLTKFGFHKFLSAAIPV